MSVLLGVARICGQVMTIYHLNCYLSRILKSYLGVEFNCEKIRVKRDSQRFYEVLYTLSIPLQQYELLYYRFLLDRQRDLRWSLPVNICQQLHQTYDNIDHSWTHLSGTSNWLANPEIDQKIISKLPLKLKQNVVS